ncbi:MAG: tRNA (adenosine(37)-N6)-threonylcarbamoyltransferase complex ATPase subunit type 1 TsaE [Moraxellaceae bacterium]|nr:tRNA (adenosine(37)-N6)-threonylcarbamoyltransferase complex ATPase subunit type 1 TsaE [Moraxellaceae bacterium]
MTQQYLIDDEQQQLAFGAKLAKAASQGMVIYLEGDLGAGKTTLTRGFLQGLGYKGNVKSPTYTLVENYEFESLMVYHFDLYRLQDPEELELLGIRDYFNAQSIVLVEWPSKGQPLLATPDLSIAIEVLAQGRAVGLTAHSAKGHVVLEAIA